MVANIGMVIFTLAYGGILATIFILVIYALILSIKALKIYIKNNS